MGGKKKKGRKNLGHDDTMSEVSSMMSMSSYNTNRSDGESDNDIIGKLSVNESRVVREPEVRLPFLKKSF